MVHGITKYQISKMNNGNVLSQADCCSYRVYILNRIIRRQGLSCNYPIENMNGLFPAVPIRETREHEPFRNMILTTK